MIAKLSALPPTARPAALRLVLARPEPTRAFLDAVEAGKLRFDLLDLDQKTALAAHPEKAIAERAKKLLAQGGGLPDPNRQKVIEGLAAVLKKPGDAEAGKKLFAKHCGKCHKHGGEGQQIGPDLTGFAVHPKEEILIAVLDPNRSVEGNYRTYTASLLDGRVITGLLSSETRTTVELLDAENKRHALNRDDLESFKESQLSLMPEGFEKQMTAAELTHLMEFMTQKGKYVPIPLDKAATAVSTRSLFFSEDAVAERLVFRDWGPKTVRRRAVRAGGPAEGQRQERDRPAQRQRPDRREDAEVGDAAVQRPGEGDPPAERRRRVGLPRRREGVGVDDRAAALRRRQDRGPRVEERRTLRGLHPPGGRAGVEVRVRAAGAADTVSDGDAETDRRVSSRSNS